MSKTEKLIRIFGYFLHISGTQVKISVQLNVYFTGCSMTSPHCRSVEEQRHRVATTVTIYLSAYRNCGHVISALFKIFSKSSAEIYE